MTNPNGTLSVGSWRLLSESADRTQLAVNIDIGGGCDHLDYVNIIQSTTSITITPVIRTDFSVGCTTQLTTAGGTIDLPIPQGSRPLVHGTVLP